MAKNENKNKKNTDSDNLAGRLLLAMPGMGDPRFHKAVIYLCAHDDKGAMGLVLNHTLPGIDLSQLLEQLEIDMDEKVKKHATETPVMSGGPVETARGFVLHSNDFKQVDTIQIDEQFSVTGTVDALKAIAVGKGPKDMLFILGYAGWASGQLDDELQKNAWLVASPDPDLLFEARPEDMWEKAVKTLGIEPSMLSVSAGHA